MSHDPGHPGAVDDGWDLGVDAPRRPVDVVRTVVAGLAGLVAACLLAVSWLLVVVATQVTSPERPGRVLAVVLAVPEVREDAAGSLADEVEEELGRPLPAAERAALVVALEDVLASDAVERAFADLRVVDGTLDARPLLGVVADRLRLGADAAVLQQETADALRDLAAGVDAPDLDGAGAIDGDVAAGLASFRTLTLVAAVAVAVAGALAALVSVAVARRRGRTLVAVLSGSLVLAGLALTPAGTRLATGDLRQVLDTLGAVVGGGTATALLLGSMLPAAVWLAVRARSGQRESSTMTS